MSHKKGGHTSTQQGIANDYKYNGKELASDFGLDWYFYGFRMYDASIGRFPSADPIAEKFAFVSPYNYVENEPIANIDLHGLQKFSIHTKSFIPFRTLGMRGEGGSYRGDNRGFGDFATGGTSRIASKIDLDASPDGITLTGEC